VVSYALPHLKLGAMRDFENIIQDYGMTVESLKNISDSTFYINKSIIEFFGTDNVGKVHGPARDILFINECNYIKYDIFDHLAIRTRGTVFLDYNPAHEFWYHDEVQNKLDHELIKSTYLDNEFLTAAQVQRIEAKKGNERWWTVYGLGELGQLEDAILRNWTFGEFDTSLPSGFGLDFGFNDPDAMVRVAIDHKHKKIYMDERIYKDGNSYDQLKQLVASHANRNDLIIADCADARMINELRRYFNIRGVNKKKWTVAEALKMMQDYEIIVTETSINLVRELRNYVWNDKRAGIPIDDFNHLIDAARYYFQENATIKTPQQWHA